MCRSVFDHSAMVTRRDLQVASGVNAVHGTVLRLHPQKRQGVKELKWRSSRLLLS